MNKLVKIEVTKEDIKKGIMCSKISCPIGLAVQRYLRANYKNGAKELGVVNNSTLRIRERRRRKDGRFWMFAAHALPERARRFIDKFDAGEKVTPFSFKVQVLASQG